MRKIRRRTIYKVGILIFALTVCVFLFVTKGQQEDIDKELKILIIERSIRSPLNQHECHHPNLPLDNPEIMKFYKPVDRIHCAQDWEIDWVMCEKSVCFVKPQILSYNGEVTCSYTDLIRRSDFKVKYGRTTKTKEPYILRDSDFVKVSCIAENGASWHGLAIGIRDNLERRVGNSYATFQAQEPTFFNVLIFGFDSLSRQAFMRKLPKTYAYLIDKLNALVLKGYNIVGDGTPQALVPLLTGYTELELPDTRKRMRNSNYVNVYPMLWKEYAKEGYVTAFNEDTPNVGIFTYRLNGFDEQPVDHYMRTYYVQADSAWFKSDKPNCIGGEPDHVLMLNYTKNFMWKYKDVPRFIFSFHGGLSHDSINLVGAADDDVESWLKSLKEKELLDDTILVFMSDHGNRFSEVRATLQGKQEERLPFFSFAFPKAFQQRFPKEYENFVGNLERLSTPFDIHATLKHLLELQKSDVPQFQPPFGQRLELNPQAAPPMTVVSPHTYNVAQERAISLFTPIPKNRSCADAYIEPHWCACLKWQEIPLNKSSYSGILIKLATNIVDTINAATASYRPECALLELRNINWAMRLLPGKDLLHYKSAIDVDGFMADLSGDTKIPEEMFQLQIVTSPGGALYEASVTSNLQNFSTHTKLTEISRINKYGAQANCIYEKNPELRKYCYCRDQGGGKAVGAAS